DGSLVTNGEFYIEKAVATALDTVRPLAKFAFEENSIGAHKELYHHALKRHHYSNILAVPQFFSGDPIDCTVFFYRGLSGWSSQWAYMESGCFVFSVFYAPDDLGGFLVVAEQG